MEYSFARAVENELNSNIFILELPCHRLSISKPSFTVFGGDNQSNGRHKHNVYELCLCLSGSVLFLSEGREYIVESGMAFLGKPLIPHEIRARGNSPCELLFFVMDIAKRKGSSGEKDLLVESFLRSGIALSEPRAELCVYKELFRQNTRVRAVQESLVEALVLDLISSLSGESLPATDTERAEAYIRANCGSEISVSRLAGALSMSERSVYYFFKENFGLSPKDYINGKRMEAAAAYLRMGMSVKDAGELMGFSDSSSLCRMFKKYYGISPRKLKTAFFQGELG